MSRDTTTGSDFEHDVSFELDRCGLSFQEQVAVGEKPGGGIHRADHVVRRPDGTELLVSCKTQNTGGTAEEKLPYELIKLANTVTDDPARWGKYAVLVISGTGWSASIKQFIEDDSWVWMPEARSRVRIYYSPAEFVEQEFPENYTPAPDELPSTGCSTLPAPGEPQTLF